MAKRNAVNFEMETEAFRRWTATLIRGMEKNAARKMLRAVAFQFLRRVIQKTPVDKGRARAGWTSYLLANSLPVPGGKDPQAVAEGMAASSFEEGFEGPDQFIILINAVSYIVLLEYGWSDQAPAGFMRLSFRELQAGRTMTKETQRALAQEIAATNRKHPRRRATVRA